MTLLQFAMNMLNTVLIIVAFCSIFNFITMISSEITVSLIISILLFVVMFIAESSLGYIANNRKYITNSYWENGVEHIISQEPNPNYPGDQKVKLARTIYLFIPQGQAIKIANSDMEYLYRMPMYSILLISIVNMSGIYLFSKKELK